MPKKRSAAKKAAQKQPASASGKKEDVTELAPLNATEEKELSRYISTIEKGMGNFVEVGNALMAIRDKKLYRASDKTFEGFVKKHFDVSRTYAYRLIDSSQVVEELKALDVEVLPANEGQAREIAKFEGRAEREKAWKKIVEVTRSEEKPITAKVVKAMVLESLGKPKSDKKTAGQRFSRERVKGLIAELEEALEAGDLDKAKSLVSGFKKAL